MQREISSSFFWTAPERGSAILVIEQGASWTGWADQFSSAGLNLRLLPQSPRESASEFAARVRSTLVREVESADVAVLAGSLEGNGDVLSARSRIVRALTSQLVKKGGVLYLDGQRGTALAMLALAHVVEGQLHASGVRVLAGRGAPSDLSSPLSAMVPVGAMKQHEEVQEIATSTTDESDARISDASALASELAAAPTATPMASRGVRTRLPMAA